MMPVEIGAGAPTSRWIWSSDVTLATTYSVQVTLPKPSPTNWVRTTSPALTPLVTNLPLPLTQRSRVYWVPATWGSSSITHRHTSPSLVVAAVWLRTSLPAVTMGSSGT